MERSEQSDIQTPGGEAMNMRASSAKSQGDIKKIDKASIIQLCSAQVVIDLKSAVKELIENSLDAKAKNIDIKFFNYGLQGFEVIDDGAGIKEVDFDIIAKRGTTSKITEFEDIYSVRTMGFRGEALSSLCNIANLTIQTKQPSQNIGWQVKFNHMGDVISKEQMAKKDGTSVIVKDLFKDLPVRLVEFKSNYKTQYARALQLIQAYAIIATESRLTVSYNLGEKTPFTNILRTNPTENVSKTKAMGDNILSVIGKPKHSQLIEFKAEVPKVVVSGFVTKTVLSGSMTGSKINKEQIFFFLNNRPIEMPRKFKSLFTEIYRQYNPSMSPIIVLNIEVEDNNYDINVSPDKREVFIKNEDEVIEHLKVKLNQFYEDIQRTKAYDCQSVASAPKQRQIGDTSSAGNQLSSWVSKKRPYSEIAVAGNNNDESESELIEGNKRRLDDKEEMEIRTLKSRILINIV